MMHLVLKLVRVSSQVNSFKLLDLILLLFLLPEFDSITTTVTETQFTGVVVNSVIPRRTSTITLTSNGLTSTMTVTQIETTVSDSQVTNTVTTTDSEFSGTTTSTTTLTTTDSEFSGTTTVFVNTGVTATGTSKIFTFRFNFAFD